MSLSYGGSGGGSESRFVWPGGVGTKLYKKFGNQLLDMLKNTGTSGLGTPLGIIGPLYENLFGESPAGDYLGARKALEETLSGEGLAKTIETARGQLLPSTLRSISEGSAALTSAAGPSGLRFSTDLMNAQGGLASRAFEDLDTRSLGAALPIFQQRAQSAQGIFDLISRMGAQNNPLQILMQLIGAGVPQLGNKGGQ